MMIGMLARSYPKAFARPDVEVRSSVGVRGASLIAIAIISVTAGCSQTMPDRAERMTRGSAAQSMITLYRALGGGWGLREGNDLVPTDIKEQMQNRTNWGGIIDSDRVPQTQPAGDRAL